MSEGHQRQETVSIDTQEAGDKETDQLQAANQEEEAATTAAPAAATSHAVRTCDDVGGERTAAQGWPRRDRREGPEEEGAWMASEGRRERGAGGGALSCPECISRTDGRAPLPFSPS